MDSGTDDPPWNPIDQSLPVLDSAQRLGGIASWGSPEQDRSRYGLSNAFQPGQSTAPAMDYSTEAFRHPQYNKLFLFQVGGTQKSKSPLNCHAELQYQSSSYALRQGDIIQDDTGSVSHFENFLPSYSHCHGREAVVDETSNQEVHDRQLWREEKLWHSEEASNLATVTHQHAAYTDSFLPQDGIFESDVNENSLAGRPEPWNPFRLGDSGGNHHIMYDQQTDIILRDSSTKQSFSPPKSSAILTSIDDDDWTTCTSIDPSLLENTPATLSPMANGSGPLGNSQGLNGAFDMLPDDGIASGAYTHPVAPVTSSRSRPQMYRASGSEQHLDVVKTPPRTLSASSFTSDVSSESLTFACEKCPSVFTGKHGRGNLRRHERLKHGHEERLYYCETHGCNRTFKRQDARLKHYRARHSDSCNTRA